jgi:hypothetical protein
MALAMTWCERTVVQTQTEIVTLPPGEVFDSWRTNWAVTQITPDRCVRDGDGDGLGVCDRVRECDGDGLGLCDGVRECDGDGLGLLLLDGLGLGVGLGLVSVLADGLGVADGLVLDDGDLLAVPSRTAVVTAGEPVLQPAPPGRGAEANAGAIATLDASKDPAVAALTARPARMIPAPIAPPIATGRGRRTRPIHRSEHKPAFGLAEAPPSAPA